MRDQSAFNRRQFIKRASRWSLIAFGLGGVLKYPACTSPRYVEHEQNQNHLKVEKSSFQGDDYVLVDSEKLEAPLFVAREENEQYTALLMLCRHKGCTVRPAGAILSCPCHGSEYSQTGDLLRGPSEKDLIEYPTSQDEQYVYIKITE